MQRPPIRKLLPTIGLVLAVFLAACSSAVTLAPATNTPLPAPATPLPAAPTESGLAATEESAPTEVAADADGPLLFVLAPAASEARYRVREQLARISFPSDAVGATKDVSGQIVLNPDGSIVSEDSQFVVNLSTLTSDEGRRDNFIKNNTLQTNQYPTAEFVPTDAPGLPSPLPTSGSVAFQLVGDLTIRDVTRPTTWEVSAEIVDQALMGQATTSFTFADFGMQAPRVPVVLSVEETIRLELDFRLVYEG